MIKKYAILILSLNALSFTLNAQGETYNWCFGDSSHLRYSGGIMIPQSYCITSAIEANASISDKNGNLLFYVGSPTQNAQYLNVIDKNHQIMPNGNNIKGYSSSTNGIIIVPFPGDTSKYYVFTIGINTVPAYPLLYEQVIDMSLNGGNGDILQKNILLLNDTMCEKLALVKHGNGRDWWLLVHKTNGNQFLTFLIDTSGVHSPIIQSIGTSYEWFPNSNLIHVGWSGEMIFSNDGDKLLAVGIGILDYFQFDRCTGILSNYQNLSPGMVSYPKTSYYSCAFSANDSVLYVSTNPEASPPATSYIYQYDLMAANIILSRQVVDSLIDSTYFAQLQIAPDGKIYCITNHVYFPNYTFDSTTMYLSTIENPNILGIGCNFQLHSFYLGGHRSLAGLPNMPNYNLGPEIGSLCDTLTSVIETKYNLHLNIFPNPIINQQLKIVYSLQQNKSGLFQIFDITGKVVFKYTLPPWSNEQGFKLAELSDGVYNCVITSGAERVSKKIAVIKE